MKLSFDITLGLNIKRTCAKHITGVFTLASQATVVERRAKRQRAEPRPVSTGQLCFPLVHSFTLCERMLDKVHLLLRQLGNNCATLARAGILLRTSLSTGYTVPRWQG